MARWSWGRAALVVACAACVGACSSDPDTAKERTAPEAGATSPVDPSEIHSIEIPVADFVFDAKVAGPEDGEAVILLHGFPETSHEWRYAMPVLGKAGYRVIAPDQRGYSPRARPTDVTQYAVLTLVQDVLNMADALGIQRFHVVGHDWGAGVAWPLAIIAKDRVISLTGVSVPHPDAFAQVLADRNSCQYNASAYFDLFVSPGATDFMVNDNAAGLRTVLSGLPEDDVAWYVDKLGTAEAIDGGLAWYRANIKDRSFNAPALGQVTVPTLFVWSSGDVALCRDGADLTEDFVSGPYQFEVIPDVSHWVVEEAHEAFDALLLAHLRAFPDNF